MDQKPASELLGTSPPRRLRRRDKMHFNAKQHTESASRSMTPAPTRRWRLLTFDHVVSLIDYEN